MLSFYGKQPNGRYFRYSSVVDSFTSLNMTREEALTDAIREYGKDAGLQKIERADRDERAESYEPKAPAGLRRWFGCTQWMIICKGHPDDDDPRRAVKERDLLDVLEMVRAGSAPVPTEPIKVTLGYVVRSRLTDGVNTMSTYLTVPGNRVGDSQSWTPDLARAARFTRERARMLRNLNDREMRHLGSEGFSIRVVRLVRTIETPLPTQAE